MINLKSSILKVDRGTPVYFLIFILIFICFSCKKDKVEGNNCKTLIECDEPTQGGGYQIIPGNLCRFSFPSFNPTDENEFIYVKSCIGDTNLASIFKYSLSENSSTLIYTGDLWSKPRWGNNDWILFSANYKVFKMKSDGSNLIQLSNENCYHNPLWYFKSNNYISYNQCLQADILFDFNGTPLDTLPNIIGSNSNLTKEPYLISNGSLTGGVSFYNFELDTFEYRYDYSPFVDTKEFMSNRAGSVFWKNNNEVIYSNIKGLNKLEVSSLNNNVFKKGCVTRSYSSGDINSSKTKMVWSIIDYSQVNKCTLKFQQSIYIMNVDGSNEEKVDLN